MTIFSIIIPTLNAAKRLPECLANIVQQDYPKENYEIIIADGGSSDATLQIAQQYNAKVVSNLLKTGEAGKMAGLKASQGQYLVFIDSDNVLIDSEWLHKMQKPLQEDSQIVASEPIRFDCRSTDHPLVRYFAYMGMADPLNLFLGNYDRYCAISNTWTGMNIKTEQKEGYLKLHLFKGTIPTIGANGFVVRKELLTPLQDKEYLFDVDVLEQLLTKGETPSCYVAKVQTGIMHVFVTDLQTFIRKQRRRVKDYIYYQSQNLRVSQQTNNPFLKILYPGGPNMMGLLLFVLSCLTIIPLLIQAIIGFTRKPDWVWIYHPIISEITLFVYATERIRSFYKKEIYNRDNWSQ